MITAEMLMEALSLSAEEGAFMLPSEPPEESDVCIDGWFDLAKAAEWLNEMLDALRE